MAQSQQVVSQKGVPVINLSDAHYSKIKVDSSYVRKWYRGFEPVEAYKESKEATFHLKDKTDGLGKIIIDISSYNISFF